MGFQFLLISCLSTPPMAKSDPFIVKAHIGSDFGCANMVAFAEISLVWLKISFLPCEKLLCHILHHLIKLCRLSPLMEEIKCENLPYL